MHSTNNLKDGYLGSGHSLRRAIRKYGSENFKFEILEFHQIREKLIIREKEIITEEYVNDKNCYNIKPGGTGGFNNKEHQTKCSQAAGLKHGHRLKTDYDYKKSYSKKISDANIRRHERGDLKTWSETYSWLGKKHKPETIEKIKKSKQGHGSGEKNSQYGTKWITNGEINRKIKKTDILPQGWEYGYKRLK